MENQTAERKKVIFSAIQPSGTITLGNYLGALKNCRSRQNSAATSWRPTPCYWPAGST